MSTGRSPYSGAVRKLVVGIDVGTTFSGVSYSILDPGVAPVIQGVHRFPAQENVGGDAKIPSIIYYDREGKVRAVGAEATLESNVENAREELWVKAEWFKLYLRPQGQKSPKDEVLPPLPLNKTAESVFGDFLRYLYDCTRVFIQETHAGGVELFRSLEGTAEFVLSHPNGWEGAQQTQMRRAAVLAKFVPDTPAGRSRIHFVTEGEASIHYCVGNNYASETINSGEGIIVVDAGGGTIDLSAFCLKQNPKRFEEIAPASCLFQGSVFVSRRARGFLQNMLYNSRYNSREDIDQISDAFDKSTKLSFKDPKEASFIKFGTWRDTDVSVNIKFGQLKLTGTDVATFFEQSILEIRQAIQEQKDAALVPVTSVLLVGGFAASSWLFTSLEAQLQTQGLRFYRPDGHLGKAVADGAVSFLIDHYITARVARSNFGVRASTRFEENDPEHQRRSGTIITNIGGRQVIPGGFFVILAKGTCVSETTPFRKPLLYLKSKKSDFDTVTEEILEYKGSSHNPEWTDVEPDKFVEVCTVKADLKKAVRTLPRRVGPQGPYYELELTVEILFGLVEHKARISWKENGKEKT